MSETDNVVEPDSMSNLADEKKGILVKILAYCVFAGFISGLLTEANPVLEFLIGLPVTILIFTWCLNDAIQRDRRIGKVMRIGLILFGYVAFPIYIFQTRGFIKGIETLIIASIFFAVMIALVALGMLPTYSGGEY